jgi:GNAT superfamily N-acetyltransferase
MPAVHIDHAVQADLPRMLEIRYAAFSKHAPSAYSPEQVETLLGDVDESELREMIRNSQLFVARKGNNIIGLAGWKGAYLRHVYVDPGQTRQGIATKLLSHVETDFHDRAGTAEIKAGVALHAEPFYTANGYEILKRGRDWDGSEYFEMIKRSDPRA